MAVEDEGLLVGNTYIHIYNMYPSYSWTETQSVQCLPKNPGLSSCVPCRHTQKWASRQIPSPCGRRFAGVHTLPYAFVFIPVAGMVDAWIPSPAAALKASYTHIARRTVLHQGK